MYSKLGSIAFFWQVPALFATALSAHLSPEELVYVRRSEPPSEMSWNNVHQGVVRQTDARLRENVVFKPTKPATCHASFRYWPEITHPFGRPMLSILRQKVVAIPKENADRWHVRKFVDCVSFGTS
eukprot:GHVT01096076.1.p3 GENE.GHVT01096076.1~~GHVT01096076.1.p3  ORF type:complete len:126 (-),score=9.05 GHVT01096076.1:1399-1776(-)